MAVSGSRTRLVWKEAPMVDCGATRVEGEDDGWERGVDGEMKRLTREVLPTPWEPRTTSLASRDVGRMGAGGVVLWEVEVV